MSTPQANKQLEKLEAKLRQRQAAVEGLAHRLAETPRGTASAGGLGAPLPSPRGGSALSLPSLRVSSLQPQQSPRYSVASPRGASPAHGT